MSRGRGRGLLRRLLPFSKWQYDLLLFIPVFFLGAYFDLTSYRLGSSPLAQSEPFLLCARIAGGLFLGVLALVLVRAARDLWKPHSVEWPQLLVIIAILNVVTALYTATTRTVFVWDTAGYWTVARNLSQQWLGRAQIREVLQSTVHMDYNYLLAFPISLVMRVFGGSRTVFIFAISNLYTLPGLCGLCALARGRKWGGLILAGCFPMLIYNGLVGFVDVAACALAIWAVVIYLGDGPAVSRGIAAGALLVGTFLLRRYFFFFAMSFGAAAFLIKLLFDRKRWGDFLALAVTGGACAASLTPNFLLEKVLGTNYRDVYSAYALDLKNDVKLFLRYFGLLLLLALLIWAVRGIARGADRQRIVFALLQMFLCFVAFIMVQSHGQQHLLLYLPALALLAAQLLPGKDGAPAPAWRRWAMAAVSAALFGWCLIPKAQPASIDVVRGVDLVPSFVFYGPQRTDIDQLVALADYVDSLSEDGEKTATVLASSLTFNGETLTNLRPSCGLPAPPVTTVIRSHGTVDKRDAFNWNTLGSDYLILGDPVQTHLGEENQQVMALFAHDVLDGTGPGSAYVPLTEKTFALENGVAVRIYRRTRDLTAEEYHFISDRLTALYPDYADQYAVPDWVQ